MPFDKEGRLTVTVDVSNVQARPSGCVNLDWVGMEVRGRTGESEASRPAK